MSDVDDEPVDDGPHCPACGQPVPAGAEYCPYCANPLRGSTDSVDESDSAPDRDEEVSEYHQVHWSDETDEWATPKWLLRTLEEAVDGFDLDPASGAETRSIASETYTEEEDGLSRRWSGTVWLNHPYSDSEDWLEKARYESKREEVDLVLDLAPARPSTDWFQKFAVQATAICFLDGRLRFGDAENDAPFPSMLLAFEDVSDQLLETLDSLGAVFLDGRKYEETRQLELADLAVEEGAE